MTVNLKQPRLTFRFYITHFGAEDNVSAPACKGQCAKLSQTSHILTRNQSTSFDKINNAATCQKQNTCSTNSNGHNGRKKITFHGMESSF